ncbi:MAG TPA: hypothetical protein PK668_03755 [Myxococcota bacterium]|nr:hypothetical protein [Myxococcota bacterium]HRY91972.1 hypothetical protein [Myxococcota bacterium]HSA21382.1 hypothetical protein [Myxococcota bacterium]
MRSRLLALRGLALATLCAGCGGATQVGDACQTDAQCGQEDGFELTCQVGVPGGYCTVRDCTPDDPATEALEGEDTCPRSARCVQDGVRQSFVCRLACDTVDGCRDIWDCSGGECENRMSCALVHPELPELEGAPRACVYAPPAG